MIFGTNNTERMRITSGGYVGINTQSPRGYFNVKNGSGELVLSQGNGRDIQAIFNGSQGNMDLSCNNLYISYLGTGTVYSNGGVLTNTNPSDANLKENITDLTFGLNEILQLRPVSYDWKNNVANQSTQYGFIAQEVQKVLPQLVTEFDSYEDEKREVSIKRLGLDKDAIFVSLVKAIQELTQKVNELERAQQSIANILELNYGVEEKAAAEKSDAGAEAFSAATAAPAGEIPAEPAGAEAPAEETPEEIPAEA